MRRYLTVLTASVFVMAAGIGTAFAAGSSDTSGDGSHCYLFFSLPDGQFAQAMVNDADPDEVLKKVGEFIEKYELVEGGTLDLATGNIAGTLCEPKGVLPSEIEERLAALEDPHVRIFFGTRAPVPAPPAVQQLVLIGEILQENQGEVVVSIGGLGSTPEIPILLSTVGGVLLHAEGNPNNADRLLIDHIPAFTEADTLLLYENPNCTGRTLLVGPNAFINQSLIRYTPIGGTQSVTKVATLVGLAPPITYSAIRLPAIPPPNPNCLPILLDPISAETIFEPLDETPFTATVGAFRATFARVSAFLNTFTDSGP